MTAAIKKQLAESLRDAQIALFLNTVAPADNPKLKTEQDLYDYWLLDVLISQDVPTTPVACAISSVQQYINRILLNMETGYDASTVKSARVHTWRNQLHQYPVWAAQQKLQYFPSMYLDPGLRNNKSDNYLKLETELNQNRLQPTTVEAAVLKYLTRFEEVANLKILNGYIDGTDAEGTYYFIARSRSEHSYFWRSMKMVRRLSDQPDPDAWSDWNRADVPIPEDAIEHTIRPVLFNNRLFLTWAQCIQQNVTAMTPRKVDSGAPPVAAKPQFLLSYCYKKTDETWSVPRTALKGTIDEALVIDLSADAIKSRLDTVAVHYQEAGEDLLLCAISLVPAALQGASSDATQNAGVVLLTAALDKHFTLIPDILTDTAGSGGIDAQTAEKLRAEILGSGQKNLGGTAGYLQQKQAKKTVFNTSATPELLPGRKVSPLPAELRLVANMIYHSGIHTTQVKIRFEGKGFPLGKYVLIHGRSDGTFEEFVAENEIVSEAMFVKQLEGNVRENEGGTIYGGFIQTVEDVKTYCVAAIVPTEKFAFDSAKISTVNTVQFIDFHPSDSFDSNGSKRPPIRLNTTLATQMIARAESGLDDLFSGETQRLTEPALTSDAPAASLDFHGANGRYFTELFVYLPWLMAHRLNAEQQYAEAERWIGYLFDPASAVSDCWKALPLTAAGEPSYADQAPDDPHRIALSHPVHFRKALYFLYIDILLNRADAAYRAMTPDSLSEAKLWYGRVLHVLGPRPVVQISRTWSPVSLKTLAAKTSDNLRAFESALSRSSSHGPLNVVDTPPPALLSAVDTPDLRLPFNPELLKRWNTVESRLYNLRHNLDITGKPLHLPVFAAARDPRGFLGGGTQSTAGIVTSAWQNLEIPPYRFTVMHGIAASAVESLCQSGATLLALIERNEQAHLQELQQQQAWDLAHLSVDLQTQALRADRKNRAAILAGKAIVQNRASFYQRLLDQDVTPQEMAAGALHLVSGESEAAASACQVIAGGLKLIPNMVGFSVGGSRWEGGMQAAAAVAQGVSIHARTAAGVLERAAQFHRRREEWTLAHEHALLELSQVDAQLAHIAEQETATRLQLRLAETALSQTKANYELLRRRFGSAQLYQWLISQFATLYYQAYDATQALCLAAEASWQYERADFSTRFIQPGGWNATYRGLGAGEQLKLSLMNMQAQYTRHNKRELEIRKTVSLRQIGEKYPSSTNQQWPQIQENLAAGTCSFELTHAMFEDDYPDHYLRRIKTISVSLPAVVGPYENIRATLTQVSSKVFLSAGEQGAPGETRRANQQVALSTGVDDSGVFVLNFKEDRYLPFEYTGAISQWQLDFPNPAAQMAMLMSLTDIIVHLSYTARAGEWP